MERYDTLVAKGAVSVYSYNIATLVFATASLIVWANILTITEIGVIAGINMIILGFSYLANLALREAATKFIPEFLTLGEKEKAVRVFRLSFMLVALVVTGAAIFLILASDIVARVIFQGQATALWIQLAAVDVWLFSVGQVFIGGMWGLNLMPRASLFLIISLAVRSGLSSILVVAGFGIFGVLISYVAGGIMLFIIAGFASFMSLHSRSGNFANRSHDVFTNTLSKGSADRSDDVSVNSLLSFSLPLLASTMMIFGLAQIDKIFLLLQLQLSDLGVYNVAVGAASIPAYVASAITIALIPSLSSIMAKKDIDGFIQLSDAYTRYVSLIAIPMSIGLASLATAVIQIFGTQYLPGAYPAVIMSVAAGVTCISSVLSGELIAVKRTKAVMVAYLAGLLAFVAVLTLLIPILGFIGAAWGRAAMNVVVTLVLIYITHKHRLFVLDRKAYSASMLASTVMGIIIYVAVTSIGGYRRQIAMLPVLVILGIVIYIAILRAVKIFMPEDKAFVERLLPQKMSRLVRWAAKLAGVTDKNAS